MTRKSSLVLQTELDDIDRGIYAIRFNKYLSSMEKIALIDREMEIRNQKYSEIQQERALEFKEFIDSLKLDEANIDPFFTIPTRCRLVLKDETSLAVIKAPKVGPFSRMTFHMKGKKQDTPEARLERIICEQSERDSAKKKDLQKKINEICKMKTAKTSKQSAELARLQAELDVIREHQKGEK